MQILLLIIGTLLCNFSNTSKKSDKPALSPPRFMEKHSATLKEKLKMTSKQIKKEKEGASKDGKNDTMVDNTSYVTINQVEEEEEKLDNKTANATDDSKKNETKKKILWTGVEEKETDPPIMRCTQTMGANGTRPTDPHDIVRIAPGYFQANMRTLSLFKRRDPSTLIASIDLIHLNVPLQNITQARSCIPFESDMEKKNFTFCFKNHTVATMWRETIGILKLCSMGMNIATLDRQECLKGQQGNTPALGSVMDYLKLAP